jgi:DNA (cytosine-5)-methyltransferase 1
VKLKMIELFAGIGGFRLASDWVGGIETIVSVEINPFCQKVLKKNFPNTPIYDDVTTYKPTSYCDLVVGGSPCQDLSIAGVQKGIIKGKRSSLWFEQLRIYKESRATFLIWENVAGAFRNGFREVLRSLSESGYDAEWQVISAAALGAPHLRERIFLIAYPTGLQFSKEPSTWADQIRCQVAIASTYPFSLREPQPQGGKQNKRRRSSNCIAKAITDTNSTSSQGDRSAERSIAKSSNIGSHSRLSHWASIEPPVCGVDAGLPNRLDRLSALGNTIVPQCAVVPLLRVKYLASLLQ